MKFKNKFVIVLLLFIAFYFNSCSWFECEAEGKVLVRGFRPSAETIQKSSRKDKNNFKKSAYRSMNRLSVDEIIKIVNSPDTIDAVKQKLDKDGQYKSYLLDGEFSKNFKTKKIKGTDVLSLRYKHSNPDFAALVVNNWMDIAYQKTITSTPTISYTIHYIEIIELADKTCHQSKTNSIKIFIRRFKNKR